jgi:regulator of protease activity HflC (stomatin/prohibitin superfamily)
MNAMLVLSALFLLVLVAAAAGLQRVPEQRVRTVRRLGRYRRTLGPGWHWIVPRLDRPGAAVELIGHHLHVRGAGKAEEAELYYQIMEPEKAGETLDQVDDWVAAQAREALGQDCASPDQLKCELNRRVSRLGLRVIRCSLHVI